MIKINLLPHRALKRAARRRDFYVMAGASFAASVLIVIVGGVVISSYITTQANRNAFIKDANAKLDIQIAEIAQLRGEIDALKARKQAVAPVDQGVVEYEARAAEAADVEGFSAAGPAPWVRNTCTRDAHGITAALSHVLPKEHLQHSPGAEALLLARLRRPPPRRRCSLPPAAAPPPPRPLPPPLHLPRSGGA